MRLFDNRDAETMDMQCNGNLFQRKGSLSSVCSRKLQSVFCIAIPLLLVKRQSQQYCAGKKVQTNKSFSDSQATGLVCQLWQKELLCQTAA